jgi:hypothetical protein
MTPAISDARAYASTVFKYELPVFEINVDGDDYLASCRTIDVPLGEDTDLLPQQSMADYRSVVGTIGYASSEFRPGEGNDVVVFVSPVCDTDHFGREASKRGSPVRRKEPSHPQV